MNRDKKTWMRIVMFVLALVMIAGAIVIYFPR